MSGNSGELCYAIFIEKKVNLSSPVFVTTNWLCDEEEKYKWLESDCFAMLCAYSVGDVANRSETKRTSDAVLVSDLP